MANERALQSYKAYEAARDRAGLTDYAVSKELGCGSSTICDWKHGRYMPKADKLYAIAKRLGIPFESLIDVGDN